MSAMVASVMNWGESFIWYRVWNLSLAAWGFVAVGAMAFTGLLWDGAWHASWGRDTFFIPPHLVMYGGIALATAISIAAIVTSSRRPSDPALFHLGPLQAYLGIWVALVGVTIMFGSAAYDDWWHRTIGHVEGDIVLWSPPHFLGLVGATLALFGGASIVLREVTIPVRNDKKPIWIWEYLDAPNIAVLMMFTYLAFVLSAMSLDRWMIYDKLRFEGSIYPLYAMLLGPGLLVLAQRVTNRAGAATFAVLMGFAWSLIEGSILKATGMPKMASLPIMALGCALLLDLAFKKFGRGYKWLALFGPVFVLVFYVSEFLWAWYLTRYPWWPLDRSLSMIPFGIVIGTASLLVGAWISERIEHAKGLRRKRVR